MAGRKIRRSHRPRNIPTSTDATIRRQIFSRYLQIFCSTASPYILFLYRGADKSLARPGRKKATATEDFDVHMSYL